MKIQYFPDTDTLYIDLAARPSIESEVINDNVIVDLDNEGKPVGITVEHYSQTADSIEIENVIPTTSVTVAAK